MKKIIITGGCGFIGSHLAEKLSNLGISVTILDNLSTGRIENIKNFKNKIQFYKVDISNKKQISKYFKNVDIVFHCAALADIVPSIENPDLYFKSNVVGTQNIASLCVENKVKKIIYTASSSCYGIAKKTPTKENAKIDPKYPYALTKYLGEEILIHWSKLFNINLISLRLFNVYGPRSRTSGTYGAMFGTFLAQKISGSPLTIVGSGKQSRDFTYISDVIDAMIKASKSKIKFGVFNVGSGRTISVNYIVKLIGGKTVKIPKRPGEPFITYANITKINKILNWKPRIRIEKGIEILIKNIHYWKKAPVWTPIKIKNATKKWFKYIK